MLPSVSSLPPGARLAQRPASSVRVIGATASILVRYHQQSRGFRFGWWADQMDRDQHREMRRRHRLLRHKGTEPYDRRPPWSFCDNPSRASRHATNHYTHPKRCFAFGRHGGRHGFRGQECEQQSRPGRNIEDVERGAWENLLFGDKAEKTAEPTSWKQRQQQEKQQQEEQQQDSWISPIDDIRQYLSKRQAELFDEIGSFGTKASASTAESAPQEPLQQQHQAPAQPSPKTDDDYVIDPITNRKVSKASRKSSPEETINLPPNSFRRYRSRFAPGQSAIFVLPDEPHQQKAASEAVHDADLPPTEAELRAYRNVVIDDIGKNGANKTAKGSDIREPVLESEEYVREHQPDLSAISDSNEASYMSWKYKGMFWGRDDAGDTKKEGSGRFDDLAAPEMKASWQETRDQTKDYPDLHKYKPQLDDVADTEVASAPKYDDLHKYDPVLDDIAAAEKSKSASSPQYDDLYKYEPAIDKIEEKSSSSIPVYDDLHKYEPVLDDVAQVEAESARNHNTRRHRQPVLHSEQPDAKSLGNAEKEVYDDLHLYKPFMFNEPDGKPQPTVEEALPASPEELAKYQPFMWNEPHGQAKTNAEPEAAYDASELAKYQPFKWNEPDGQPNNARVELGHEGYDPAEVQKYQPFMHNEPDGKPIPETLESSVNSTELNSYGAVRYQEPDGQPAIAADAVAESLKEYDEKEKAESAETSDAAYSKVLEKLEKFAPYEDYLVASKKVSVVAGNSKTAEDKSAERKHLESSMTRMNAEADTVDELVSATAKSAMGHSGGQQPLSGAAQEQDVNDPYSKDPCGLETSFAEENQGAKGPLYVKVHRRVNKDELEAAKAAAEKTTPIQTEEAATSSSAPPVLAPTSSEPSAATPFVYKILAYDPMTQAINVAETTSTVPDSASPLTPADALLRLTHPTKFLEHFQTLQSQGFEIVSGSGDVLVFRKLGDAEAASSTANSNATSTATESAPINPIDHTGTAYVSPSAANFASPTGYVNLDLPPLQEDQAAESQAMPPPPSAQQFRSNIDVRREEPVFSGPKAMAEPETPKQPGVLKRMFVGAAWLGGVSYGLGLLTEYIKGF